MQLNDVKRGLVTLKLKQDAANTKGRIHETFRICPHYLLVAKFNEIMIYDNRTYNMISSVRHKYGHLRTATYISEKIFLGFRDGMVDFTEMKFNSNSSMLHRVGKVNTLHQFRPHILIIGLQEKQGHILFFNIKTMQVVCDTFLGGR